jgi:hypothetical protein
MNPVYRGENLIDTPIFLSYSPIAHEGILTKRFAGKPRIYEHHCIRIAGL